VPANQPEKQDDAVDAVHSYRMTKIEAIVTRWLAAVGRKKRGA
jgi:hypothetical protein